MEADTHGHLHPGRQAEARSVGPSGAPRLLRPQSVHPQRGARCVPGRASESALIRNACSRSSGFRSAPESRDVDLFGAGRLGTAREESDPSRRAINCRRKSPSGVLRRNDETGRPPQLYTVWCLRMAGRLHATVHHSINSRLPVAHLERCRALSWALSPSQDAHLRMTAPVLLGRGVLDRAIVGDGSHRPPRAGPPPKRRGARRTPAGGRYAPTMNGPPHKPDSKPDCGCHPATCS